MSNGPKTFPTMPARNWWALRERFRKTLPSVVDANYVASALDMSERSAQNNILPALKATELIDSENKPTDRAVKWRDDVHYPEVCTEMRTSLYPQSLLDLADPEDVNRDVVMRWFANTAKVGENQARKLTSFYMLLCDADPSNAAPAGTSTAPPKQPSPKTRAAPAKQDAQPKPQPKGAGSDSVQRSNAPEFHFNIQVHISPDSSPEQIDKMFESMSKHLRELR